MVVQGWNPTSSWGASPTVVVTRSLSTGDWLALCQAGDSCSCSGHVEVLRQGPWGTFGCDRAVTALGKTQFGLCNGDILLDNVQCSGAECHLGQCTHWGWAEPNCGPHEDARVTCSDTEDLPPPTPPGLSTVSQDHITGGSRSCGGVLTRLPDSFSSPGYPENYPPDTQCVWEIHVDKKSRIKLMIPSLKLEDIVGCPFDSVEVFDGPRITSISMGRFCAPGAVLVISSSDIMTVVFRSDSVVTNSGFHAQFDRIPWGEREPGGSCPEC
ncbi:hypothetical protein QTO34_005736 [Cnephaeus nilssonii]|uniref:Uncharacterized protein n=1 Tax=Cnephaeus nilssonii TaxID=3371016 RepID=A0AA40HLF2_CNENI|nr:hypothetical protein QTO34_005736 [Eptesicus nilssonii]